MRQLAHDIIRWLKRVPSSHGAKNCRDIGHSTRTTLELTHGDFSKNIPYETKKSSKPLSIVPSSPSESMTHVPNTEYNHNTGRLLITTIDFIKDKVLCSRHGWQQGWWFEYRPGNRSLTCPSCLENEIKTTFIPATEILEPEESKDAVEACAYCPAKHDTKCIECGQYICKDHSRWKGMLCLDCEVSREALL